MKHLTKKERSEMKFEDLRPRDQATKDYEFYHNGRTPAEDGAIAARKENSDEAKRQAIISMMNKEKRGIESLHPEELEDDNNPLYVFSSTHTELLLAIATGKIDAKELAREEMANRGLDDNGKWIGFSDAKEGWRVK